MKIAFIMCEGLAVPTSIDFCCQPMAMAWSRDVLAFGDPSGGNYHSGVGVNINARENRFRSFMQAQFCPFCAEEIKMVSVIEEVADGIRP